MGYSTPALTRKTEGVVSRFEAAAKALNEARLDLEDAHGASQELLDVCESVAGIETARLFVWLKEMEDDLDSLEDAIVEVESLIARNRKGLSLALSDTRN